MRRCLEEECDVIINFFHDWPLEMILINIVVENM